MRYLHICEFVLCGLALVTSVLGHSPLDIFQGSGFTGFGSSGFGEGTLNSDRDNGDGFLSELNAPPISLNYGELPSKYI